MSDEDWYVMRTAPLPWGGEKDRKYHTAIDLGFGYIAPCNAKPLDESTALPVAEVARSSRCRSSACAAAAHPAPVKDPRWPDETIKEQA